MLSQSALEQLNIEAMIGKEEGFSNSCHPRKQLPSLSSLTKAPSLPKLGGSCLVPLSVVQCDGRRGSSLLTQFRRHKSPKFAVKWPGSSGKVSANSVGCSSISYITTKQYSKVPDGPGDCVNCDNGESADGGPDNVESHGDADLKDDRPLLLLVP